MVKLTSRSEANESKRSQFSVHKSRASALFISTFLCTLRVPYISIPLVLIVGFGKSSCAAKTGPDAIEPERSNSERSDLVASVSVAERDRRNVRVQLLAKEKTRQYRHCEDQGYGSNWCACVSTRIGTEEYDWSMAMKICDRGPRHHPGNIGDKVYYTPLEPKILRSARDTLNCNDFSSENEAQRAYLKHGGPARDPHNLDGDGDGNACEYKPTLPIRPITHDRQRVQTHDTRCHWVRGYTRKNGTRVRGHQRCR